MFNDLFDEMSKLFDENLFTTTKYSVPSFPPLRVVKRDNKVTFRFALAGYSKEDLDISFGKDCLILSTTEDYKKRKGKEQEQLFNECLKKDSKARILVDTFKDSCFSYKYFIPENSFNFEKTVAEFKDGILTIVVPARDKKVENKVKKVEIK